MSDLMPYRLRFEKRQRLQRQKARHENRIEQDAACQSEIQPFFQHQCRSSHRETASISGEQTDRQALQGYGCAVSLRSLPSVCPDMNCGFLLSKF